MRRTCAPSRCPATAASSYPAIQRAGWSCCGQQIAALSRGATHGEGRASRRAISAPGPYPCRREGAAEDLPPQLDALLPIFRLVCRANRIRVATELGTELAKARLVQPVPEIHRRAARILEYWDTGLLLKPPVGPGNHRPERRWQITVTLEESEKLIHTATGEDGQNDRWHLKVPL
jgi:hypothetical protein